MLNKKIKDYKLKRLDKSLKKIRKIEKRIAKIQMRSYFLIYDFYPQTDIEYKMLKKFLIEFEETNKHFKEHIDYKKKMCSYCEEHSIKGE